MSLKPEEAEDPQCSDTSAQLRTLQSLTLGDKCYTTHALLLVCHRICTIRKKNIEYPYLRTISSCKKAAEQSTPHLASPKKAPAQLFLFRCSNRQPRAAGVVAATRASYLEQVYYSNVASRLVIWASLMRFFLIQAETKKMTGSNNAFFLGWAFLGWVSSCLLMANLKAATT